MARKDKIQTSEPAPGINWNVEYPIIKESMQAFLWDNAARAAELLRARRGDRSDPENVDAEVLHIDVEDLIWCLMEIKYGVKDIEKVRSEHPEYNVWVENGIYGGNTRYWCEDEGLECQLEVRTYHMEDGSWYFEIRLVCATQFF